MEQPNNLKYFEKKIEYVVQLRTIKKSTTLSKFAKIPGDQEGLFKLAIQLRNFFNWVIYNTATGYVLLVYLTHI
jgi:hypothetical protein